MTDNILLEMIEGLPEVMVYMEVEGARKNIYSLANISLEISQDPIFIKKMQNVLDCIDSLKRFGLTNPLSADGQPSNEYWAWQRWWRKYLGSLSKAEFQKLMIAIKFKEDLSAWRPEGTWKVGY